MTRSKTTHWVWETYTTEPGMAFVTDVRGLTAGQDVKMLRGERLKPVPRIAVWDMKKGRLHDQLGSVKGGFFISPKLRSVLEAEPSAHIQYVPVEIPKQPAHPYFAVNVLDLVPALDLERSDITWLGNTKGVIYKLRKFVMRPLPPDVPAIFRVAEQSTLILVNDDLHRRLTEASDHPGHFTPVEKFKLGYF